MLKCNVTMAREPLTALMQNPLTRCGHIMPTLLSPLRNALHHRAFLVSLVSGVAIFFHWGPGAFHGIHEWLSMVLILPFVLHLWKKLASTVRLYEAPTHGDCTGGFPFWPRWLIFIPSGSPEGGPRAGNPQAVFQLLSNAKIAQSRPLYRQDGSRSGCRTAEGGVCLRAPDMTLSAIASASGKSDRELIGKVAALRPR